MERVTGIGGVFFKVNDPKAMAEWYHQHLGITFNGTAADFRWVNLNNPKEPGHTVFSFFKTDSTYFDPAVNPFMINFRVKHLRWLLEQLKKEQVTVVGEIEEYEYGNFGWILDPEGNKIELWEPADEKL